QPRPQVTGASDVQDLVVTVAEEVDPRRGGSAEGERPLCVDLAHARRRELREIGHGAGAALLREAEQAQQDLRRRLRVGKRAVTRARVRAEETCERREAG